MDKHSVSMIVSSYNQSNGLRLVLAGFAAQDDMDFEMIVADDGSEAHTIDLVRKFSAGAPFIVRFVTQDRTVFGKTRILNKAVLESEGDRLVFCDGDCVPFRNFVSSHRRAYRPHRFCTGGYVLIGLDDARALTPHEVPQGTHERFLTAGRRAALLSVHLKNLLYQAVGRERKPKIQGRNWSIDCKPFFDVDGFDEVCSGVGKEDSDIRNRLRNIGSEGVSLWHKSLVCHLDHWLDLRRDKNAVRSRADRALYKLGFEVIKARRGLSSHDAVG